MQPFKTYYQILGIRQSVDDSEIKKAFRLKSLKYHPDKNNGSPESNTIFIMLVNAYEILSDKASRVEYDSFLNCSSYIRSFSNGMKALPSGSPVSNADFISLINIILWEIEDVINSPDLDKSLSRDLLVILTSLDKEILSKEGFPDYFMQARQQESIDPEALIDFLLEASRFGNVHLPYTGLNDYFYDIRKRFGRFADSRAIISESLAERIIRFHNDAVHRLRRTK